MKQDLEHTRLDFADRTRVTDLCREMGCSEAELKYCASKVGHSVIALEAYWHMNADSICAMPETKSLNTNT